MQLITICSYIIQEGLSVGYILTICCQLYYSLLVLLSLLMDECLEYCFTLSSFTISDYESILAYSVGNCYFSIIGWIGYLFWYYLFVAVVGAGGVDSAARGVDRLTIGLLSVFVWVEDLWKSIASE